MPSRPILDLDGRPRWRRLTAGTLSLYVALLPGLSSAADGRADVDRQVTADRSVVASTDMERIKRLLETPPSPLVHQLSGLSADSGAARAQRERHTGARQLYYSQSQGGGSSSHGNGWLALAVTGTVVGLTGVVLGSYGDSDACHSRHSPYFSGGNLVNVCDNYSKAGVGLAIGGLSAIVIGIVGAIASSSHQSANGSTPPSGNSGSGPASQPTFVGAGQSGNIAGFDAARQAIDEIRSQNPGTLPPAEVTGSNRGGSTTLEVKNDTEYALHVFLAGPQSEVLNLLPGYSQKVTILPGQYEIAARVDAINVRPFYGTQPLAGGTAYGESFYIVRR